ncbi:ABC transporter ATP-binding protein [Ktedonosporobacter rubrisoli]|uniref:ABC transporter ATP-binding protein n=1 Tax=Ktedonosporobacter rubrisoli TaxID=2509675 RepID=A0A4P6JQU7_KTERU|nr:ABC transporter ATP-binding protein [Ktedonosporobacter rubrisoli]QBD77643.1 ABC transporter ATP-binding protein [Ktedonosporobacter rubrisoli]
MGISLRRYAHLLLTYLKPHWRSNLALAVLLFSSIGLQLLSPQVISYFIDTIQARGPLQVLLIAAGIFIIISVVQRLVAFASTYLAENIGWLATNALRADLVEHCLRLDMSFHKQHTPGELIERVDSDVTALANFFSQFTLKVLGNGLLILGVLLFLLQADWRAGFGLIVYSVLTLCILSFLQKVAVNKWAKEREANADFYGFLEEHISGTEDIRAIGAEQYVTHRLFALMRRLLETYRAARLISNFTNFGTNTLYVVGYTVGLALGAYLYSQHQITLGTAYVIVYYIGLLAQPLDNLRQQLQDLQQAEASIERVEQLFMLQPEIKEDVSKDLPSEQSALTFQNVSFSYDQQEYVLQDLNFQLQPGKVLGLLGHTGSGKTTLARLLFRLYDPPIGAIRLNGIDLREIALEQLRTQVGMVTQDVQLFQASIRDNLTFFNRRISDATIEQALHESGLSKWVQSLPHGLDTQLAAGGQGLSAGEAQLLAFARVFLKNPSLVVLDEASSRLDPATEYLLEQAMKRLLEGRTGIIIAHRLHTVLRADEIMILDHGNIVEHGSRLALANDPHSRFCTLLQTGLEEVLP